MDFIQTRTTNGKKSILYQGFWYRFDKYLVKKTISRWRCTVNKCRAVIKTKDDVLIQDCCNLVHNHDKKPDSHITRRVVNNKMTKNIKNNLHEKPSKIIRDSMQNYTEILEAQDRDRLRRNLYRAKVKHFSKLPKTSLELHDGLDNFDTKTCEGEEFLYLTKFNPLPPKQL